MDNKKEKITLDSYAKALSQATDARLNHRFPYFDHGFELRRSYDEWSPTTTLGLSDEVKLQLTMGRNDVADGKLSVSEYAKYFLEKTGQELGPHKTAILTNHPSTLSEPSSYAINKQWFNDYFKLLKNYENILLNEDRQSLFVDDKTLLDIDEKDLSVKVSDLQYKRFFEE